MNLIDHQGHIRHKLYEIGRVPLVADCRILPRASGVGNRPMIHAIAFKSPESLSVTLELPHDGTFAGMGIRKGITVTVGGGYQNPLY